MLVHRVRAPVARTPRPAGSRTCSAATPANIPRWSSSGVPDATRDPTTGPLLSETCGNQPCGEDFGSCWAPIPQNVANRHAAWPRRVGFRACPSASSSARWTTLHPRTSSSSTPSPNTTPCTPSRCRGSLAEQPPADRRSSGITPAVLRCSSRYPDHLPEPCWPACSTRSATTWRPRGDIAPTTPSRCTPAMAPIDRLRC